MKWLTLDTIRRHLRICIDDEDSLLELYGESAEETVLELTRQTYDEIVEIWGTEDKPVPAKIIHASLLLVDHSYMQRSPVTQQNLYTVPYALELLLKPFMKLVD